MRRGPKKKNSYQQAIEGSAELISKETLQSLVDLKLTSKEVAAKLNCNIGTVMVYARKYGLSFKYSNKSFKKWNDNRTRILSWYKRRAKKIYQKPFTLTEEEFYNTIQQACIYCGREKTSIINNSGQKTEFLFQYTGIDRINSSEGYIKENCVPCCFQCNCSKGNLSHEEFQKYLNDLIAFQIKKNVSNN